MNYFDDFKVYHLTMHFSATKTRPVIGQVWLTMWFPGMACRWPVWWRSLCPPRSLPGLTVPAGRRASQGHPPSRSRKPPHPKNGMHILNRAIESHSFHIQRERTKNHPKTCNSSQYHAKVDKFAIRIGTPKKKLSIHPLSTFHHIDVLKR